MSQNPQTVKADTVPSDKMTTPRLLSLHASLTEEARRLMEKKNADYADNHSPFGNLDLVEAISRGEMSTELGIIIRLGDKLSRLYTSTRRELSVKDEGIRDTLLDIINYAVLLYAKHLTRHSAPVTPPPADDGLSAAEATCKARGHRIVNWHDGSKRCIHCGLSFSEPNSEPRKADYEARTR